MILGLGGLACFDPPDAVGQRCDPSHPCPDLLTCVEMQCVAAALLDSGIDVADSAVAEDAEPSSDAADTDAAQADAMDDASTDAGVEDVAQPDVPALDSGAMDECPVIAPATGWLVTFHPIDGLGEIDRSVCYAYEYDSAEQLSRDEGVPRVLRDMGITTDYGIVARARHSYDGMTRFTIDHNDGMRFYVDESLAIDNWSDTVGNNVVTEHYLSTPVEIRAEVRDDDPGYEIIIAYDSVCDLITSDSDNWAAAYYSLLVTNPGGSPTFAIDYTDCLGAEQISGEFIAQNYGASAPAMVAARGIFDEFAVVFTGRRNFESLISVTHEDGLRIYDSLGTELYSQWLEVTIPQTASVVVSSGSDDYRFEYFNYLGDARCVVN